ncbi:MAG: transporter substrate-binding domain-containing protein [Epsilonproteobacteria bacterium]|nr:transporter substrate-binding domain-containing protein [Campylobacterota bacterium]
MRYLIACYATEERKKYLLFTKPYLSVPLVITTKIEELFVNDIEDLRDKKIGFVKGYAYAEIYKRRYPHLQIELVENIQEGFKKLHRASYSDL